MSVLPQVFHNAQTGDCASQSVRGLPEMTDLSLCFEMGLTALTEVHATRMWI
jgi:hypothetical protein